MAEPGFSERGRRLATVTITITDESDSPDQVATIETKTNWKPGDPDSPAVQMAMAILDLLSAIRDGEDVRVGGTD